MTVEDIRLIKEMCSIRGTSGNELGMRDYILGYIEKHKHTWKVQPVIHYGKDLQDGIVLAFGKPRTAIFAHIDTIGFTVRYGKQLVKIGGPRIENGYELVGEDSLGEIECKLLVDEDRNLSYEFEREIDRGTPLSFKPTFYHHESFLQCCYMDNRLGVWNALKVAETLEDGVICFTCWEEHGAGNAEVLGKFIYTNYDVTQTLISDITWVTEGVIAGEGVAISLRDSGIPRKSYTDKIITLAKESGIPFQLEVESSGGSDGNSLQRTSFPFDWCFIGAPESNVHSPLEKVHIKDIESMLALYKFLMKKL